MSKSLHIVAVLLLPLLATACKREAFEINTTTLPESVDSGDLVGEDLITGEVVETMNANQYTYVQLDTGTEKIWAAGPITKIAVGDKLGVSTNMPMHNFPSKTLDRTFELIYFCSAFQNPDGTPLQMTSHGSATADPQTHTAPATGSDVGEIVKAEGGKTIGEIYAAKSDLAGKEVKFRGKVTKYNAKIMGKNWLHVQDGSGVPDQKTHDLTVTTDTIARVGDTVLVTGTLQLEKDFGHGYYYPVIVEDAQVVVEE